MKVFISQPMTGLTEEEILTTRNKNIEKIKKSFEDTEIIESYFSKDYREFLESMYDDNRNWSIYYLGMALQQLSYADLVWMCEGWENSTGCHIEQDCAEEYGIKVLYPPIKENEDGE